MDIQQLTGRHLRLRRELAAAYASVPWNTGLVARLVKELAANEREMATSIADRLRVVMKPPSSPLDSRAQPAQATAAPASRASQTETER